MQDQTQALFHALADPSRRAILQMLRDEALPIKSIMPKFNMSRPAVAKHLQILENAQLIEVQKKGRERVNHLRPDQLKIATDWLDYFNHFWDERLAALKNIVEEKEN